MDIKRLPPSILVALGLAGCGPRIEPDDDTAGDASDSQDASGEVSTSACLDVDPTDRTSTGEITTGPCLGQEYTTSGPCLAPELTTTGESGSGSESGSDSGSEVTGSTEGGSDSGGTTTGPCLAPPGDAPAETPLPESTPNGGATARAEILERLRSAGILPPDVAAKLEA